MFAHKNILALIVLVAFLAIAGCDISDSETITSPEEEVELADPEEDTRCQEENIRGNSVGNIGNNGFAALQGEWIYYKNSDDDYKLYKIKTDGSERQKVNNDSSGFINVVGDWIYYQNGSRGNRIYKIKTDGSERQKINNDPSIFINVVGDWIYYQNRNDSDRFYRIKTDGSGREKVQ